MRTMWQFRCGRFTIRAAIAPAHDLDLSWDDTGETADKLASGEWEAFDTRVAVYLNGAMIGDDWLCGSIYADPAELFTGHRDPDPMNRNCSEMRAARGGNVCIGHYFPDMVRTAIDNARDWLASASLDRAA